MNPIMEQFLRKGTKTSEVPVPNTKKRKRSGSGGSPYADTYSDRTFCAGAVSAKAAIVDVHKNRSSSSKKAATGHAKCLLMGTGNGKSSLILTGSHKVGSSSSTKPATGNAKSLLMVTGNGKSSLTSTEAHKNGSSSSTKPGTGNGKSSRTGTGFHKIDSSSSMKVATENAKSPLTSTVVHKAASCSSTKTGTGNVKSPLTAFGNAKSPLTATENGKSSLTSPGSHKIGYSSSTKPGTGNAKSPLTASRNLKSLLTITGANKICTSSSKKAVTASSKGSGTFNDLASNVDVQDTEFYEPVAGAGAVSNESLVESDESVVESPQDSADVGVETDESAVESNTGSSKKHEKSTEQRSSKRGKGRKRYMQKYKQEWEDKLPWLKREGDKAYCKVCEKFLEYKKGGFKDLKTHQTLETHRLNAAKTKTKKTSKLHRFMAKDDDAVDAHIRLCLHGVEKNLSFTALEAFVPVVQTICKDSKIASTLRLHRTKATCILANVTGETQRERLIGIMRRTYFSIIVDESTNISTEKVLCIVVRYYDEEVKRVRDAFYDLVEIANGKAETLYEAIRDSFVRNNISYKIFLLGLACDNANVMVGSNQSLFTLLRNDCRHLVLIRCVCHSMALCASYAVEKLPEYLEQTMKDIYGYITASPARLQQYKEIQELLEYSPTRVPRLHEIRFLSRGNVVSQVLKRYEPLKMFFGFAANVDKMSSAIKVKNSLNDPITLLYFDFLNFILPVVDGINKLFQAERPEIISMHSVLIGKIKQILGYFVEPHVLESDLKRIEVKRAKLKRQEDVYYGVKVAALLRSGTKYKPGDLQAFHNNCLNFYIELGQQMIDRLQLDQAVFKSLDCLLPSNIKQRKFSTTADLLTNFCHVVDENEWQKVDDEYNELVNLDFDAIGVKDDDSTETFWNKVIAASRGDGEQSFPLLSRLVKAVLSLPHSSAAAERIFSAQNLNKTKLRNRLKNRTLVSILRTKDWLKTFGNSRSVTIPQEMRRKYNNSMYDLHTTDDEAVNEAALIDVLNVLNE